MAALVTTRGSPYLLCTGAISAYFVATLSTPNLKHVVKALEKQPQPPPAYLLNTPNIERLANITSTSYIPLPAVSPKLVGLQHCLVIHVQVRKAIFSQNFLRGPFLLARFFSLGRAEEVFWIRIRRNGKRVSTLILPIFYINSFKKPR